MNPDLQTILYHQEISPLDLFQALREELSFTIKMPTSTFRMNCQWISKMKKKAVTILHRKHVIPSLIIKNQRLILCDAAMLEFIIGVHYCQHPMISQPLHAPRYLLDKSTEMAVIRNITVSMAHADLDMQSITTLLLHVKNLPFQHNRLTLHAIRVSSETLLYLEDLTDVKIHCGDVTIQHDRSWFKQQLQPHVYNYRISPAKDLHVLVMSMMLHSKYKHRIFQCPEIYEIWDSKTIAKIQRWSQTQPNLSNIRNIALIQVLKAIKKFREN
jgi:hypothetical protein